MSLANRGELVTAMTDWLNRNGSTAVAARCLDFIALCESSARRELRLRQQIVRSTASLDAGHIRLPGDFLEAKQVQINLTPEKPVPLDQITMEQADDFRREGRLISPKYFVLVGDYLEVVPYVDTAHEIEMAYYKTIPPLADNASTNWLLAAAPDYYLYGSLVHSAPYLRDDERIATWATGFTVAKDALIAADERTKYAGGRLRTRAKLRY